MERVAIITGGAQGIGKGIAKTLLEMKLTVIILDKDKTAGKATEKEFHPFGKIQFIATDISDESEIKKAIQSVIKEFKRIDFLINNAGFMNRKSIENLTLKEWNEVLNVNLTSIFLCAKYSVKQLRKNKGCIVNISSTRALMSEPNTESYSATKGGIVALTHALAISLGPEVRVNCISPGWIDVNEWKKPELRHETKLTAANKKQHPVGRVGTPEDVASLVKFLISDEAGFITGSNFTVDGGMTRKMIYV